jgi:carbamate kinase
MKLVIALGGNALLRRDQTPTTANLLVNVQGAASQVARIANLVVDGRPAHQIVLAHGSGPQVGLLALQSAAYAEQVPGNLSDPLDILDAEVSGQLGYLLEQAMANLLPATRTVASLLTRVEVDRLDPAFKTPSKPIGPVYTREQADRAAAGRRWTLGADGPGLRRLVASPMPVRVLAMQAITVLLDAGAFVIAGGGGGIPVMRRADGLGMEGVEAVIDKDRCSALMASELQADCLVIATDVDAVYANWGQPGQRKLQTATADELARMRFAQGSMAPKVEAVIDFVRATRKRAVIGSLDHIEDLLSGRAGTQITC